MRLYGGLPVRPFLLCLGQLQNVIGRVLESSEAGDGVLEFVRPTAPTSR
jgi:hypothetical protein